MVILLLVEKKRDEGRDKSSLSFVDEQVEVDLSESLLQYEKLCKLSLSAIITHV